MCGGKWGHVWLLKKKKIDPFFSFSFFYWARLLHLPFVEEQEEPASEPTQEDIEKDFEVFYLADSEDTLEPSHCCLVTIQVSTSQEVANIPEAMVLEEKKCLTC